MSRAVITLYCSCMVWFFHIWYMNSQYCSAFGVILVVFSQLWLMFCRLLAVVYVSTGWLFMFNTDVQWENYLFFP